MSTLLPSFPKTPLTPKITGDAVRGIGSPADIAQQMSEMAGFVWLDSSLPAPGSHSLLTAQPTSLLHGSVSQDWHLVEDALDAGARADSPGGLFGWVGFDGKFVLGIYPHVLVYDHDSAQWFDHGALLPQLPPTRLTPPRPVELHLQSQVPKEHFLQQVRRAQQYIAAGDIYQVNLSHPWQAHWPHGAAPLSAYRQLRQTSPAPHAAFLHLADTTVLSASPELFLKIEGRNIVTRPIKGTRPRYPTDTERDSASRAALLASEKERAELLMITDLERNDLGQICEFGSVHVADLWQVESFAQVFHLVSTICGTLRPGLSHAAAFRACFPGGSITGAPKRRALEIIHELEPHPRGIYTGALGYFGFQGSSQWSIAIRTAVRQQQRITFHTGSGIVADSIPELEWEETLHKASGLITAWSAA